jgi:hypothetical protein
MNLCTLDHHISAVHYTIAQLRCHKSFCYCMSGLYTHQIHLHVRFVYTPDTSSCPVCIHTRYIFMSGLYTHQIHLHVRFVYTPDTSSPTTWKCRSKKETMKAKYLQQSPAAAHNSVWKMDQLWQIVPCCKVMGSYCQSKQSSPNAAPHRQVTMWPAHVHCTQHDATGMNLPQTVHKLSSWQHLPLPPFNILEQAVTP